jgi:LPXTG-motif cell wall-anchored protein
MYQRWGNTDSSQGGFEETALIPGLAPVPEMSSFFPIVGLLVAVGSTSILRRRRMAKVNS